MVIRELQEENNQTHNALQKELVSQRQQMEMHMARIKEQHQEVFQKTLIVSVTINIFCLLV